MKKNVFLNQFKGKSIEDLNYIIRNKDRYTTDAVEAAKQLLNSNNQSNSNENDSRQSEIIEEKKVEPVREEEIEKEKIKGKNYLNYVKTLTVIIVLFIIGFWFTNSSETPMDQVEKDLAQKYQAESLYLRFQSVENTNKGKLIDEKKLFKISVTNPDDFGKILSSEQYADQKGKLIAQYVLDSINFESIPFQPEELVVEFVKNDRFILFSANQSIVKTYNLSN